MTSPPTNLLCQYRYDPLDRLVHQTQPDTPAHQRFYCKSRLATEIHGATTHSIIQHDDLLMAEQQREGDVLDTTLLVTDLQRSVLHTLKKGVLPRPIAYSPYGHRPVFSVQLSLLGFNGERPDPVTGCYLLGNGYRAFNPVLMRFNTPDSWSPYGKGGINSYAYCLGDPTNKSDRSGQAARSIIFPISRLKILARRAIKKTSRRSGMAYDGGTRYAGKFRQGFQIKKGVSIDQAYSAIDQLQQLDEITGQRHITEKLYDSHRRNPDYSFLDPEHLLEPSPSIRNTNSNRYKSMLESIEDRKTTTKDQFRLNWNRLDFTAGGSNLSNLDPIERSHRQLLALKYLRKMQSARHPDHESIIAKIKKIRGDHFEE